MYRDNKEVTTYFMRSTKLGEETISLKRKELLRSYAYEIYKGEHLVFTFMDYNSAVTAYEELIKEKSIDVRSVNLFTDRRQRHIEYVL